MKKFFCLCLSLVLLLSFSFNTNASSQHITFFSDGSYLISTLEDTPIDDGIMPSSVESKSKSTVSAKSFTSEWKITDNSSSISKNSALAKVTAKQYLNSTVINIINRTLKLTCSPTGEFS